MSCTHEALGPTNCELRNMRATACPDCGQLAVADGSRWLMKTIMVKVPFTDENVRDALMLCLCGPKQR